MREIAILGFIFGMKACLRMVFRLGSQAMTSTRVKPVQSHWFQQWIHVNAGVVEIQWWVVESQSYSICEPPMFRVSAPGLISLVPLP